MSIPGTLLVDEHELAAGVQARLVEFVRLARANDFKVGVAEELDAQRVVLHCGISDSTRLKWGLRALLCSDHDDWQRFDELYNAFWLPGNVKSRISTSSAAVPKKQAQARPAGGNSDHDSAPASEAHRNAVAEAQDGPGGGVSEGASCTASLASVDFQALTDPGEMRAVEVLVDRLARSMRKRAIRRQRLSKTGKQIDLRKTLRNSLRFGGTPLVLSYRQRIRRQPRLVLIVDVSRSMSMYSFFFLRFARSLTAAFRDVAVFAYHTHLLPITEALRQTDLIRVSESLALMSQGWSGGTRIGESLETFNDKYGQILNSRSIAVIVSDGLDTGDPEHLAAQLARIKPRCSKLVWLNPLLGRDGYEPVSQGMRTALPYLDLFAPAHNLHSLQELEPELTRL